MAKMVLVPELVSGWKPVAKAGIQRGMRELVERSLKQVSGGVIKEISDIVTTIFDETPVVLALRGQAEPRLDAHFGLPQSVLSDMADQMRSVLSKSIRIGVKGTNKFVIMIRMIESDYAKFLSLPNASYISRNAKGNETLIPLMQWMLIDPNIDIGQAAYSIVFAKDSENPQAIRDHSRSGRAIMKPLGSPEATTPYVLPDIFRMAGENFLVYALAQPQIVQWFSARVIMRLNKAGGVW